MVIYSGYASPALKGISQHHYPGLMACLIHRVGIPYNIQPRHSVCSEEGTRMDHVVLSHTIPPKNFLWRGWNVLLKTQLNHQLGDNSLQGWKLSFRMHCMHWHRDLYVVSYHQLGKKKKRVCEVKRVEAEGTPRTPLTINLNDPLSDFVLLFTQFWDLQDRSSELLALSKVLQQKSH